MVVGSAAERSTADRRAACSNQAAGYLSPLTQLAGSRNPFFFSRLGYVGGGHLRGCQSPFSGGSARCAAVKSAGGVGSAGGRPQGTNMPGGLLPRPPSLRRPCAQLLLQNLPFSPLECVGVGVFCFAPAPPTPRVFFLDHFVQF